MAFSLAPLLLHHEAVPHRAREALREGDLEEAARILFSETDLECRDVRELVGLPQGTC